MVFSSLTFLLLFLPILLTIYFLINNIKIRIYILLLFSLIFYAWGEPIYILLMILSIIITYCFAILIDKTSGKTKKNILIISIVILLSSLFFFKYYNFVIGNINALLNINITKSNLSLPIGISFYTFQAISYLCDVYNNKIKVQKNILYIALYISLFPQLIAGPIVRYETIEKEINQRIHTVSKIADGLKRFIIGLSKKVLIANGMATIVDTIFSTDAVHGTVLIYIGAICYTLQIYYDFSGYSDMAIGLGKVFGFEFLENFNYPYISKSITEFWRRWHISLSTWFRDYVYIPLGGNRNGKKKQIRNIIIVWILTGLWHGASWNFIIWGLYYCTLLLLEKFVLNDLLNKIPNIISHIITIFLIIIGWVIFRITDLNELLVILKNMIIFKQENILDFILNNTDLIYNFYIIIPAIFLCRPLKKGKIIKDNFITKLLIDLMYIIMLLLVISSLISNTYNPFIYFRF